VPLKRALKDAQIVEVGTPEGADLVTSGKVDAFAANKANVVVIANKLPGSLHWPKLPRPSSTLLQPNVGRSATAGPDLGVDRKQVSAAGDTLSPSVLDPHRPRARASPLRSSKPGQHISPLGAPQSFR